MHCSFKILSVSSCAILLSQLDVAPSNTFTVYYFRFRFRFTNDTLILLSTSDDGIHDILVLLSAADIGINDTLVR